MSRYKETRSFEQLKEHYQIEKELADRLRSSSKEERKYLYANLYDELFRRVAHHPQLTKKLERLQDANTLKSNLKLLNHFLFPDSTFLEIGAGDCALSIEICKLVRKVYAVDVSQEITENLNTPSNFELIISDGSSIPAIEGSVDIAYSNQLMEHLHPEDALDQICNIYQALKPGGQVYMCNTQPGLRPSRYFKVL